MKLQLKQKFSRLRARWVPPGGVLRRTGAGNFRLFGSLLASMALKIKVVNELTIATLILPYASYQRLQDAFSRDADVLGGNSRDGDDHCCARLLAEAAVAVRYGRIEIDRIFGFQDVFIASNVQLQRTF